MAIKKTNKADLYDHLVDNLIMEFTVGGDRFDPQDVYDFITAHNLDREYIYKRLRERQLIIDKESIRDLGHSILPDDFFRNQVHIWLFKKFDDSMTLVFNDKDERNYKLPDGSLLVPDMWFDMVSAPDNGTVRVCDKDHNSNIILSNGKFLSPKWFEHTDHFYDGFAVVGRGGRQWFVDRENKPLVADQNFRQCMPFINGVGTVLKDNDKRSFVGSDGKVFGEADDLCMFNEFGTSFYQIGDLWYMINKEGKTINDVGFKNMFFLTRDNHHLVSKVDGQNVYFNIVDGKGSFMLDGWVKKVDYVEKTKQNVTLKIDDKFMVSLDRNGIQCSAEAKSYLKGCRQTKEFNKNKGLHL